MNFYFYLGVALESIIHLIVKNRSVGKSPYNAMMFEREARVVELLIAEGVLPHR